jgi:predicted nucleic acid-binding protein
VILVDSTVWIDLLRSKDSAPVGRLRALLLDGEAALAPVIAQEILQGASSPANLERLRTHFLALPMLGYKNDILTHAGAGGLYARCRWAGITPRSPHDCLIAQTAIEHGVPLLHDDRDFERIAEVEPKLVTVRG